MRPHCRLEEYVETRLDEMTNNADNEATMGWRGQEIMIFNFARRQVLSFFVVDVSVLKIIAPQLNP
jgi:hypothetical protein